MSEVTNLLDRPLYGMTQVDHLLGLKLGTAKRWIDGYTVRGRVYEPVVRRATTGVDLVTWGEFVETRLLAEFRGAGVPMINLRPAVSRLREEYGDYPLAQDRTLAPVGRDLLRAVQDEVELDAPLLLVVVRNNQLVLTESARNFWHSLDFLDGTAQRLRPLNGDAHVVIDPLRGFGEPVVRNVRTEIIAELRRAGETVRMISETYELTTEQVDAALRYELVRLMAGEAEAA